MKHIENDVINLLVDKGYKVEQMTMSAGYVGNPPYTVSWEDKGE